MTSGLKATTAVVAGVLMLSGCASVREGARRAMSRDAVVTAPSCQDFDFPIYFETGADQLTTAALQVIDDNAPRVRACEVASVSVTGLADAAGTAERNLELSRRRATTVAQALSARGYPTPTFDLAAGGDAGASGPRGSVEPMRRVTQVNVRFAATTPR